MDEKVKGDRKVREEGLSGEGWKRRKKNERREGNKREGAD